MKFPTPPKPASPFDQGYFAAVSRAWDLIGALEIQYENDQGKMEVLQELGAQLLKDLQDRIPA